MSLERARAYLEEKGLGDRIIIPEESSATVELAAKALGTQPERIAKTMSFLLGENAVNTGIKLRDMKFRKNILVTHIIRGGRAFIPGGNDTLEIGDDVLIVTTQSNIKRFADIFA